MLGRGKPQWSPVADCHGPFRANVGLLKMSGDVVVLLTAVGVLFVALAFACAIAYGFWRGGL